MFEITSGVMERAQKIVIYGPEGIGKSTFASKFPDPLFIDTEGSTSRLDVRRTPKPTSWDMLRELVQDVIKHKPCGTLIIDTVDWAEQLCIKKICDKAQKNGIEEFGYGKGYVYEKEEFAKFLNLLSEVIEADINVVLTAHAKITKFELPEEMGAYDRWELKLGQKTGSQISPLVKEWADAVFFAHYKILSVAADKEGKKHKAQGGSRIMQTAHNPCWDAKNRFGLPDELPFEYSSIEHIIPSRSPQSYKPQTYRKPPAEKPTVSAVNVKKEPNIPDGLPEALKDLMRQNDVDEADIRAAVALKGYMPEDMPITDYPPDFINGCLIGAWEQVLKMIADEVKGVPF